MTRLTWMGGALLPAPLVAAFLAGWLTPAPTPTPVAAAGRQGARMAIVTPGINVSAAASDLAAYIADDGSTPMPDGLQGDPPPIGEEGVGPVFTPPPPPPPLPDIGLVFRRQVTGVVSDPAGQLAVLVQDADGGLRRLHVGERFQGAWMLVGLTRDSAVLNDGVQVRRIPFFGGPVTGQGVNDG